MENFGNQEPESAKTALPIPNYSKQPSMKTYSLPRTLKQDDSSQDMNEIVENSEVESSKGIIHTKDNTKGNHTTRNRLLNPSTFNEMCASNTEILNFKVETSERSSPTLIRPEKVPINLKAKNLESKFVTQRKAGAATASMPKLSSPEPAKKNKVIAILKKNYSQAAAFTANTNMRHMRKRSEEQMLKPINKNVAKNSSCRDQFSSAVKHREPVIPNMFRTRGSNFREDVRKTLPNIEKTEGIFKKYRQSIDYNRDILDESPAMLTRRLRETGHTKQTKSKNPVRIDNLLLTQRVENAKFNPQSSYLLNNQQRESYALSPGEMEIARLMENKKDYEPGLIQNALLEQAHIRHLTKIIMNLKERGESQNDKNITPTKLTIEALLNVVEEKIDETIKTTKREQRAKTSFLHNFPIKTNFEQTQQKAQKDFLTYRLKDEDRLKDKPTIPKERQKQERLKHLEEDLKTAKMLYDMDTFRFFKDFTFPIEIESLKAFCKINEKNLHTKMIRNLMVFEKLFTDYEQVEREKEVREKEISTMIKYLSEDAITNSNF